MSDYPDDDYFLWCELNPCPECDGVGSIEAEDGEHTCRHCGDGR